jgi:26S proteasome regulatory subunit N8
MASIKSPLGTEVQVHPLVLLSAVDHFGRMNKQTEKSKRVVGVLLGSVNKDGVVDVSNSFAVPFEEDPKAKAVWFLDTNFAGEMYRMFRKVWSKAKVVGWYSTGPPMHNDMDIHNLLRNHFATTNPVFVIINVDSTSKNVPATSYVAIDTVSGTQEFRNVPTVLASIEPEEIGIEHLLRELTDSTVTTLSTQIAGRKEAVEQLDTKLGEIEVYLNEVAEGKMAMDQETLGCIQELFVLLPQLHQMRSGVPMTVVTNDAVLSIYVASLSKCVLSIHDLILNKRKIKRDTEQAAKEAQAKKEREDKEAKAKESKDKIAADAADNSSASK